MSRHTSSAGQRGLTLTEELERLEQSITLTLQEIDYNFSKAHRIVTSSILPLVQQYGEHSRDMWENSKFWKQFFEASANVSLSGYEEQAEGEDAQSTDVTDSATHMTLETSQSYDTPPAQRMSNGSIQDIDLSNLTISPSHSTPRPGKKAPRQNEEMRKEAGSGAIGHQNGTDQTRTQQENPQTPLKQAQSFADLSTTPEGSPATPRSALVNVGTDKRRKADPILHRVLDRNYRVQATPLKSAQAVTKGKRTPTAPAVPLDSSPLAPPELHAEIFDSPIRRSLVAKAPRPQQEQRMPGVSVLTPARGQAKTQALAQRTPALWDSDDDDDGDGIDEQTGVPYGLSPPKTMSFHVPQSRLLRTPAREASKQIVDNILASAGVGGSAGGEYEFSEDFDIDLDVDDERREGLDVDLDSPSVVRQANIEDETFG